MANIVQADWDAFWERQEALCAGAETVTRPQPINGAPIWPNRQVRAADARAAYLAAEQARRDAATRAMLRQLAGTDRVPVKFLAVGDSITDGTGSWDGQGYVPALVDALDQRHHAAAVAVDGVSGSTLPDLVNRWPATRAANPDATVVLLHVGTNDTIWTTNLTGWQAAHLALVDRILADLPAARIVCAQITLTDVATLPAGVVPVAPLPARQTTLNGWIAANVAARPGRVTVADMSAIPSSWMLDSGIHPGPTAYQRMGRIWCDAIPAAWLPQP